MLDYKQKTIDPFFKKGGRKNKFIYHLSQSYLDYPKKTLTNNSKTNILFEQIPKVVENTCGQIADFHTSYKNMNKLSREARTEEKYVHSLDVHQKKFFFKIV